MPRAKSKQISTTAIETEDRPIAIANRPQTLTYHGFEFWLRENEAQIFYELILEDVAYVVLQPKGGWRWSVIAIDLNSPRRTTLNCRCGCDIGALYEHHTRKTEPDAPHWCEKLAGWLSAGYRAW